jgi:hypothetical protein
LEALFGHTYIKLHIIFTNMYLIMIF